MSADAAACNVMVGIGETYLPAFVLALTASEVASGLISTVPLLAGSLLQLISPWMVWRWQSHRRWVVLSAVVQAMAFAPLVGAALAGAMPVEVVFLAVSIYWGAGLAGGPAWNAWAETLVPGRIRARYFARRTRLGQWGLLAGFVAGGCALQFGTAIEHRLQSFAVLFLAAAAGRLASATFLATQREAWVPCSAPRWPRINHLGERLSHDPRVRVILYLLAAQLAVQVAGPYFTPYMLRHLELSYLRYVVLICAAYVAKIAMLPLFGRLADRYGAHQLLWVGGVGIIPVSGLWVFSDNFGYLLALQVLSGAAWAAFELAMLLLLFEATPRSQRVEVLTLFNLGNALATVLGSMAGGAMLWALAANRQSYLWVFAISSIARAAAVLLLVRLPQSRASQVASRQSLIPRPRLLALVPQRVATPAGSGGPGPHYAPAVPASRQCAAAS